MQQRRTPCIFLKLEQPILTLSCGISLNTLVFSLIRDCCVVRSSIDILLDPGLHKIIDRIQIWVAEGPQVCVQDVLHVRPASHPILILFCFTAFLINWSYLWMYDLYPISSFTIFLTSQSILTREGGNPRTPWATTISSPSHLPTLSF